MFPVRDDHPSPRFPFVNIALIVVNVWVFFVQTFQVPIPESFIAQYAMIPARDFTSALFGSRMQSFLTSMFLHGGFFHLLLNMWSLWIFGDNVEGRMGSLKYLIFYVACGLVAGGTHAVLYPNSVVPVVGASGAIAGVMGAYLFLFPKARLTMFFLLIFYPVFFELPAIVFLVLWFGGQLMSGTAVLSTATASAAESAGVAFWAHIGGFVAGATLLPFFKGKKPTTARRRLLFNKR